jgi:hypothetical protein
METSRKHVEFLNTCEDDLGVSVEEGRRRLEQDDLLLLDPSMRYSDTDAEAEAQAWEEAGHVLEDLEEIAGRNSLPARVLVWDAQLRARALAERARNRG